MSINSPSARTKSRRKAPKRKQELLCYTVLHSTQLSRSIAHGLLYKPSRETLELFSAPVDQRLIEAARNGLDYGVIVLVELDYRLLEIEFPDSDISLPTTLAPGIPLAFVRRVVFKSKDDLTAYTSRASTYGDVPLLTLEYAIEQNLFRDETELFEAPSATRQSINSQHPFSLECAAKFAGMLAAVMAASRWRGDAPSDLDKIAIACDADTQDGTPSTFLQILATKVDDGANATHGNTLLALAGSLLSAQAPNTGFDPDAFLSELCDRGLVEGLEVGMLQKFATRATAVLSGASELNHDAFCDVEGKVAQRALLLFMLNPELEALRKISIRLGSIGQGVLMLGCALAGCRSGIAAFDSATKAPDRAIFLGTTLLAWRLANQRPTMLKKTERWTATGVYECKLSVSGYEVAHTSGPAAAALLTLRTELDVLGVHSNFNLETGSLEWQSMLSAGSSFYAVASTSPSLPFKSSVDICTFIDTKFLDKGIVKARNDIAIATRKTGIYAKTLIENKTKGLELSVVCIENEISRPAIILSMTLLDKQRSVLCLKPLLIDTQKKI